MNQKIKQDQYSKQIRINDDQKHFTIQEIDQILQGIGIYGNNQNNSNDKEDHVIDGDNRQCQCQINKNGCENIQSQFNQIKYIITLQDIFVSKDEIVFGTKPLLPGAIQQIQFSVILNIKSSKQLPKKSIQNITYILRIISICNNKQFDNLDEYVFSIRNNNQYQYYQQVRFKIKNGQRADVRIAVKIPQITKNYDIQGIVQVKLENMNSQIDLQAIDVPIVAHCVVPQIACLKFLYKQQQQIQILKIPAKKGQYRLPLLPFKNNSELDLKIDIETISIQNYQLQPYDIITQNFINCQSRSIFWINMQLKENINYKGKLPSRMSIRKILLFKIKNSSCMLYFPIQVNIFQGQFMENN